MMSVPVSKTTSAFNRHPIRSSRGAGIVEMSWSSQNFRWVVSVPIVREKSPIFSPTILPKVVGAYPGPCASTSARLSSFRILGISACEVLPVISRRVESGVPPSSTESRICTMSRDP